MPGYVLKALKKYQHPAPKKPQHAPHKWNAPIYGQKIQMADKPDNSKFLNQKDTRKIQSIAGTFLYYGRAVENPVLVPWNDIRTQQSKRIQ